jgi:hypothetical protein
MPAYWERNSLEMRGNPRVGYANLSTLETEERNQSAFEDGSLHVEWCRVFNEKVS